MAGGTLSELRREIDIQRGLTHPNICRLFESFEEDGHIYIIMEVTPPRAEAERRDREAGGECVPTLAGAVRGCRAPRMVARQS